MTFKLILTSLFILLLNSHASNAMESYCDALLEEKTYKDNRTYKKLIKGNDNWVFRTVTDFESDFEMNSAGKQRFRRLGEALRAQNIELVVALLPTRAMMHADKITGADYDQSVAFQNYQTLATQMGEQGLTVASISSDQEIPHFFYKRDHHWAPDGAKVMAQKVAEEIKKLPIYQALTKNEFVTEVDGEVEQRGTFSKFINTICESDLQPESVKAYKTTSGDTDDLFGETTQPEIILIGTSNSSQIASKANFDGFLKEYIGADVDNLSVSGGGADSSFFSWLHSEGYKNDKPKIVVWEIPIYQDFDSGPFFRQLIPATYGSCKEEPVSEETLEASPKISIFNEKWQEGVSGKSHYLEMNFEDKSFRRFRISTSYQEAKKDVTGIRRSKFYEKDGIFYYEFDQNREENIKEVSLVLPPSIKGNVTARLCAY